jgi:AraC family transcriptional regulator
MTITQRPKEGDDGLTDRLVEHDRWLTSRLPERAAGLADEQLDREIRPGRAAWSDEPRPG